MLDEALDCFFCFIVASEFDKVNYFTLQNTMKCFDIGIFFSFCYVCKFLPDFRLLIKGIQSSGYKYYPEAKQAN
jgi:hypothetical protein